MITNEELEKIKTKAKVLFDRERASDGKSHMYIDEKGFYLIIDKLIEMNAAGGFVEL